MAGDNKEIDLWPELTQNVTRSSHGHSTPSLNGVLFSGDFFVSLSATLRENGWTDLHEIFREGVPRPPTGGLISGLLGG